MGKLMLLPAEVSDLPEILEGQRLAFSDPVEPFFFALFPETEKKENFEQQVKRTETWWVSDPSAKYMKVVDEETGKIVSAAKWCIYETPLTEEQMHEELVVDWHPDEKSNQWAQHIIHSVHSHRLRRTNGGVCCVLDMMSTHPDHHRRGAGKMLVQWGCDIADKMGVEAFIEGTSIARRLYESCGFVATPTDWVFVDVPGKWKDMPQIKYYFFERQPREKAVDAAKNVVKVELREAVVEEVS
ncbi:acyl-CoA N-acyltransferase [Rhexocercosporidium sp. MPI-PUGE-AT-0058]|nr:acyl-CoA N-acyltransferase [Rhexocercosporidium sp. MPI-PUGE-AT-0058]